MKDNFPTLDDMLDEMMEHTNIDTDDDDIFGESVEENSDPGDTNPMYTNKQTRSELTLEDDDDDDDLDDDLDDLEDDDDEDEEDDEDIADDISDLSDEELRTLAHDLEDMDTEEPGEGEDEVQLTPDEEIQADDMMSVAGAASLIRNELNVEERTAFLENATDVQIAMAEGFLNEPLVLSIKESVEPITEAKMYNKTTVHFSKKARMAQLHSLAVLVSARAHNDPDYIKYKKACKLKKIYKAKMGQKYESEARKRVRVMFARMKNSKSSLMKKLGDKMKK